MEPHEQSPNAVATLTPADFARLLREISHELRTPLGSSAIWLRLSQENADPNERAHAFSRVQSSFDALTRVTSELTDCASLLEGTLELQRLATDLGVLVDGVVEGLRGSATRRGITLEPAIERGVARLEADRERLTRSIESLLGHAIMCRAPELPLPIRLTCANGRARIEAPLPDSGWISLNRLADRLQAPRPRGAIPGLTLPLALEVLALHGGRLVRSNEASDSMMVVELPLA